MTTLNLEIYDALLEAKVSEEKARAAAGAIIPTDQLATKEDVSKLRSTTKESIGRLETKVTMLMWMIGLLVIIIGVTLSRSFLF